MMRALAIAALAAAAIPARAQEAPASLPNRMPIRGGSIIVKVPDFAAARDRVTSAARREGAEILEGKTVVNQKGWKHGWINLRVSAERAPILLQAVREMGKLYSESAGTVENVSEYEQLERRIARIREHQKRLDGILKGSRKLRGSDILYVQERLFRAGIDEGELLQRRLDLERAARTSVVTVTLFEPGAPPIPPRERIDIAAGFTRGIGNAWLALQRTCSRAATAAAYVLVFAPFWIPALILAALMYRLLIPMIRRQIRKTRAALYELMSRRRVLDPTPPLP